MDNSVKGNSGISKANLIKELNKEGVNKKDQQNLLSIFDSVDADENIKFVEHNDGVLGAAEVKEFLNRVKGRLGELVKKLFIKTVGYEFEYETDYDGDGKPDKIHSKYNENFKLTDEVATDSNGEMLYEHHYIYDKNGKPVRYNFKGHDGSVKSERYIYNDKNQLVKIYSDIDGNNEVDAELDKEYDENGNLARRTTDFGANGSKEVTEEFEYDDENRLVSELYENKLHNKKYKKEFEYDDENRIVHQTIDNGADGNLDEEYYYEYDELGEKITTKAVDEDGDGIFEGKKTYFGDAP